MMKIAIIGTGNMGGAIARGLAKGSVVQASDIICSNRTPEKLEKLAAEAPGIRITRSNREAAAEADLVILAVKPWLVEEVIGEIKPVLDYEKQIVISVVAGVDFDRLSRYLQRDRMDETAAVPTLFRVIPNTAIEVKSSMTILSACRALDEQVETVTKLFGDLGHVLTVPESLMTAGSALASCGIAFALRYIRAAMEGGVELGFYPDQAKEIVAQTLKGAADLILAHPHSHPEAEIDKVTTPGGITIKGLNAMEAAGFTHAVIEGLKASK